MDQVPFSEDQNFLSSVIKGIEELRQSNKRDIRESQIYALTSGDKTLSDLNKYLFTLATFVIPLSASLIGLEGIRNNLNAVDRVLVGQSLVLLFLSLLSGFGHMIVDARFYIKWLRNTERSLQIWSSTSFWPGVPKSSEVQKYINEYDSLKARSEDISKEMENGSTRLFLYLQAILVVGGIIPILVVAFKLLAI